MARMRTLLMRAAATAALACFALLVTPGYVVSAFPPPLRTVSPELRRDLAEALRAKAGRRTVAAQQPAISARAKALHDRAIVVDSHDDTTQRLLFDKTFDIAKRNKDGHIDIPRMREGGLDAL